MKATQRVIENLTGRTVKKVSELAYVVVAVFTEGRPQFIGKKAILNRAQTMNADDQVALTVLGEWQINPWVKSSTPSEQLERLRRRVERARFLQAEIKDGKVIALVPNDEFDFVVAKQIAKENGWAICNGMVSVAV